MRAPFPKRTQLFLAPQLAAGLTFRPKFLIKSCRGINIKVILIVLRFYKITKMRQTYLISPGSLFSWLIKHFIRSCTRMLFSELFAFVDKLLLLQSMPKICDSQSFEIHSGRCGNNAKRPSFPYCRYNSPPRSPANPSIFFFQTPFAKSLRLHRKHCIVFHAISRNAVIGEQKVGKSSRFGDEGVCDRALERGKFCEVITTGVFRGDHATAAVIPIEIASARGGRAVCV